MTVSISKSLPNTHLNCVEEEQLMVDLIDTIVYAGRLKDKSA